MLKGKKLGDAIIGEVDESKKRIDGAEKLRAVVDWMNSRNEHLNQGKSHLDLIADFNKKCNMHFITQRSEQFSLKQLWIMAQKYNQSDFVQMVAEVEKLNCG